MMQTGSALLWPDHLLWRAAERLGYEHLSSAMHRNYIGRIDLQEVVDRAPRFILSTWPHQVKSAQSSR